jgi:hypothetical protein
MEAQDVTGTTPKPGLATAEWTSQRLNLPLPTLYEFARREPDRFGVTRFGRKVMFRRARIEELVDGA